MLRRLFWLILFPGGVVSAGVWGARHWLPDTPTTDAVWLLYPYLVLLLGGFYAFRFGRIRILYLLGLLVVLERFSMTAAAGASGRFFFLSAATLVPFNFALVAWMRERGMFSHAGILRLTFFALQGGFILWMERSHLAGALAVLELDWISWLPEAIPVPQTVLFGVGAAAALLVLRFLRQPNIFDASLCWSLGAIVTALAWPQHSRVCLATSGLIATVAVIEMTHFMAFRDELTGLPARRALGEYLARLSGRYTLVMADVDHFKKVNDTYGHDVGDQVLRMVASRLARVGGGGRAFRYGGEEFTLVFPGKGVETTVAHVEKLRDVLASNPFVMRRPGRRRKKPQKKSSDARTAMQFSVTASFGMAQRDDAGLSALEVIKRADEALYRAKRSGRNRVAH